MTTKTFDTLSAAVVALSLAAVATGCDRDTSVDSVASSDVGSLGFNLTLPNSVILTKLTYTIDGPSSKTGEIPLSGSGTTFSAQLDGLKAGGGYTIELDGTQSSGAKNCTGKVEFKVNSRQTTTVKVGLSCPGLRKAGAILLNGTVNVCAVIESAVATLRLDGKSFDLTSSASDDDMAPMARAYAWKVVPADAGTFSSATSANAIFTCEKAGDATLTVETTDGDCGDKMDVMVTCMVPDEHESAASCLDLSSKCGRLERESCCTTMLVEGGTFSRNYDALNHGPTEFPGRVSDLSLDKYEVTVGRFRKFIAAWNGGWRPATGAGKHTHLNQGLGLRSTSDGYESGWDSAWNAALPTTSADWDRALSCDQAYQTWSSATGANEALPLNCATWYEHYAFCIWDGGFLPTITERNYAASGGDEQRTLPWSIPPISSITDPTYASYCTETRCGPLPVGSKSPKGNGRYGQADLVGSLAEATLDRNTRNVGLCDDCVQMWTDDTHRVFTHGSFFGAQFMDQLSWPSTDLLATERQNFSGVRCARPPQPNPPEPQPGAAVTRSFASCDGLPQRCGPHANEDCCASGSISAGAFNRDNDPSSPATLSAFRLDRFEVTIGRFRSFASAWNAGFRPLSGAGKHAHLNGGRGLATADAAYESGWDPRWNANIASTTEDWNEAMRPCYPGADTWTPAPNLDETRPAACMTFYELYAFCIWDGGFLPSEAEWAFAASAGDQQRIYPWGVDAPDDAHAVFGTVEVTYPVGSRSPLGDGYGGQADLAGNAPEWVLDFFHSPHESANCTDCVDLTEGNYRVARGGGLGSPAEDLKSSDRGFGQQATRGAGGRCARAPE